MKRTVISGAVLALAISGMGVGSAAPANEKITGGGQVVFSTSDAANSTIAFTAQESADDVKGQVQLVDRSAGKGQAQTVLHGTVTCVNVIQFGDSDGMGSGKIGGYFGDDETDTFVIDVTDGGEGGDAADQVVLRRGEASNGSVVEDPPNDPTGDDDPDVEGTCDDADDFQADVALVHGNVQVHKAKS